MKVLSRVSIVVALAALGMGSLSYGACTLQPGPYDPITVINQIPGSVSIYAYGVDNCSNIAQSSEVTISPNSQGTVSGYPNIVLLSSEINTKTPNPARFCPMLSAHYGYIMNLVNVTVTNSDTTNTGVPSCYGEG
jgi:hypothetical protein